MPTPIGTLIVEAEGKTKRIGSEYTAKAPCGCEVRLSRFSAGGTSNLITPCSEHALDPNRKI
jgi:hypothetical protein